MIVSLLRPFDVPLDPDADTARRWLSEELGKREYQREVNVFQAIIDWLAEQLDRLLSSMSDAPVAVWVYIVAALVLIGVIVAVVVLGPVRASRHRVHSHEVLREEVRTAAQLRQAAEDGARSGQYTAACLDRFRAIVRSLEERAILTAKPGRTAHEVSRDTAARLPTLVSQLAAAGDRFDAWCYGKVPAQEADYRTMTALDDLVARTRPTTPSSDADRGQAPAPQSSGATP